MLKVLPHILYRVGGMSFSDLETLNVSQHLLELIKQLNLIEQQFLDYQQSLLSDLKQIKSTNDSFSVIRKIKKQVYKKRFITTSNFQSLNQDITHKILIYNQLFTSFKNKNTEYQQQFEFETYCTKRQLQALAKNNNFQNALPLSSISFAKRLEGYLETNPTYFRKKELQTERRLMQYISRVAAKTSPFSSFTTVSYGKIGSNKNTNQLIKGLKPIAKKQVHCRYNNQILQLFQNLFLSKFDFLSKLNIRLNTTLEIKNEEYRFLMNHQNIEVFQTIESQDFLAVIESYFEEKPFYEVEDLIFLIIHDYEIDVETVVNFLKELVAIGFFEIDFGYNTTTKNWLIPLKDYLAKVPCTTQIDIKFVETLYDNLNDFKSADKNKRISILKQSHQIINNFIERHFEQSNLSLDIPLEQLIYEDVSGELSFQFDESAVNELLQSLHELLQQVHFLQGKERLQIEYFYNLYFGNKDSVPLLDFYEQYYKIGKQINEKEIPTIQAEAKLLKKWQKAITDLVQEKHQKGETLNLKITDLVKINTKLNISLIPLEEISLSCFTQLFEEENTLKAVINAVSAGYGKTTGRFLNLMPDDFTNDLKSYNLKLNQNTIKADNTDASFFNANLHPPLFRYEIYIPNSNTQLDKILQINVNDLSIKKHNNKLVLWHNTFQKEVHVFDLGIQTPNGRSPLYQLLTNFSPIIPDLQYLKNTIKQVLIHSAKSEIQYLSAVNFGNLILLRASIIIPNLGFLTKNGNELLSESFRNCHKKIGAENIFNNFFMKQKLKNVFTSLEKRNRKKPIYFNLNNIILFDVFSRLKTSENNVYELIQMLPNSEKLFKFDNKKYFLECVFQWYKYQRFPPL